VARVHRGLYLEIQRRRVGGFSLFCSERNNALSNGGVVSQEEVASIVLWGKALKGKLKELGEDPDALDLLDFLNQVFRSNVFLFGIDALSL